MPVGAKFLNAPDFDFALPPGHHEAAFGNGGDNGGLWDCREGEVVFDTELAEGDNDGGHVDT